MNHLSQGVRYHAEGSVGLGWYLVSVMNNPLEARASTLINSCLPPLWSLSNPQCSWDQNGYRGKKKTGPRTLKRLPSSEDLLEGGSGSFGTSEPLTVTSAIGRDEPPVWNLPEVKSKTCHLGVRGTGITMQGAVQRRKRCLDVLERNWEKQGTGSNQTAICVCKPKLGETSTETHKKATSDGSTPIF
jgi:hypothetical protein